MPVAPSVDQATESGVDQDPTQQPAGVQVERSFETASDEFWKNSSQINGLNAKRSFDEYQDLGLQSARLNQQVAQRASQNGLDYDQSIRNVSVQALQNAVETANLVGKQAVAHRDIAINNEWDQQAVIEAVVAQVLAKMAQTQEPK